jgi:outer membrane protein assembly factor BamB
VVFGTKNGIVYCLDKLTGLKIWEYKAGRAVHSSPVISNGMVYFGSDDGYLYALDLTKGTQIWRYQTTDIIRSTPTVYKQNILVGGSRLYCLKENAE